MRIFFYSSVIIPLALFFASPYLSAEEELPNIVAKNYAVQVIKISRSTRTYLFSDGSHSTPTTGRILLLKKESEPIMALKVLKTYYPEKNEFAATRVQTYGDYRVLDTGISYSAIEKIMDVTTNIADKKDLKEPEIASTTPAAPSPATEVLSFDPELDAGTSPPPAAQPPANKDLPSKNPYEVTTEDEEPFGADSSVKSITAEDVYPLDVHKHWLSTNLSFFRNSNAAGGSAYFAGAGIRYAFTLRQMIFLRRALIQDSLALETGLSLYKVLSFVAQNDAYTVYPIIATLRYNILFGENYSLFLYAGILKNIIGATSQQTNTGIAALSSTLPAGGGGMIFRVGPQWYARADLGIDMLGLSLMLRF